MYPRVGEDGTVQLELDLFPGEPWQGHSPRALTRGALGLIFKAQAVKSASAVFDVTQLDFFPRRRQRLKRKSRTAPTLLPLPSSGD